MKFKEYVENLNQLLKDRPETADYIVCAAGDDEGNYFSAVVFAPSVGEFEFGDFTPTEVDDPDQQITENAVCIN